MTSLRIAVKVLCFGIALFGGPSPISAADPPNIVFILADDLGYGDLACQGHRKIRTPHIDRLAASGTRFTNFLVAQPVCTASRAALMTGCYPNRLGMHGALNHQSMTGLNPEESTIAEVLKTRGYVSACYGKWHLGHRPKFSPLEQGFSDFLGIPYSNDNGPLHPVVRGVPSLPWIDGSETVELDPDQAQFTRRLTERAIGFMEKNRDRPFFLYLPHVMPHVPIFASDRFRGKSSAGLYGDVVEELDAAVGNIVAALDRLKLTEKTLVLFSSDNGPFLSYGNHAGSAGPLREGKLTTFEGGVRVPFIASRPGVVKAGRTADQLVTSLDLLPTFAAIAGSALPKRSIDGMSVLDYLTGASDKSPRSEFYYYGGDELHAVRQGNWKLHLPHEYLAVAGVPGRDGKPANIDKMKPKDISESGIRGIASRHGYDVKSQPLALYDLSNDPGETNDLAVRHPDRVKDLLAIAEQARQDLGDSLTKRPGKNLRPVGKD